MGDIVLAGATSGTTTLTPTAVSGTTTLTLPATTDTLVGRTTTDTLTNKTLTSPTITGASITVASTAAPAFSAYSASAQNPTIVTFTKVIFGTEVFDTNNNFASSTFTPTVAGYYQVSASISMAADTSTTVTSLLFYKNGAATISNVGTQIAGVATATYVIPSASSLIYMNGTTDYLEVYGLINGTGALRYFFASSASYPTVFTGFLARSA